MVFEGFYSIFLLRNAKASPAKPPARSRKVEDSGTGVDDIRVMAGRTGFVSGLEDNEFGGDPSPSTAYGVFLGIRTAVRHRLGRRFLLTEAKNCANDRYGDFTIMFGSLLEQKCKGSHVISPA